MTNVNDAAVLRWTGVGPLVSPFMGVREQDWRQPAVASFFIDNLVIWNDPRIDVSQWSGGQNRWAITTYQGAYGGVPSGYIPGTNPVKKSYWLSNTQNTSIQKDPMTGILMNHAELQFILSEAALKGYITGNPETYYKNGVQSSIQYWLPNWTTPIDTYLTAADLTWNSTGTLEEKMQQIHLQKYYALFLVDLQQWFEYRRTGYPVLPAGPGLRNNGEMPSRLPYPVYVQSTNPTNYRKAITVQGPDLISTKVWWQKP